MAKCPVCSNLQPDLLSDVPIGNRAVLFVPIADLKLSISAPSSSCCPECALIWHALTCYKTTWDETDSTQSVELRIAVGKPLQLFFRREGLYLELFSRRPNEDSPGITGDTPTTIGPATKVSLASSSDICFQRAASWLQMCVQSHPACGTKALSPLPTRVMDVGIEGVQEPCLLESRGQLGQYVALSYCWGDPLVHNVLKTTSDTFEKHKKCIEFSSLPKTLQDAVTITRRLGLKYLWIDALCIIQGDADDWVRESSQMCNVYSNAHLTITGANSSGTSAGIFNSQTFGSSTKELRYKGTTVYVRNELARTHDVYSILMRNDDPDTFEPINRRAWTLQEALLSNRVLHYRSSELVWECNEMRRCECGYGSAAISPSDEASNRIIRQPDIFGPMSLPKMHQKWAEVVQLFTERQLGYDEDKLPALSGLAKKFAETLKVVESSGQNGMYLAGIWCSNLARSLLWSVEDDLYRNTRDEEMVYRRPKAWRAPSWSWASVEGPVNIEPLDDGFESCVEIVEELTEPSTTDPYGQVKDGKLVVKGRVVHELSIEVADAKFGDSYSGFTQGKKYLVRHGDILRAFICDDGSMDLNFSGSISCLLVGIDGLPGALLGKEEHFLVLMRKFPELPNAMGDFRGSVFERIGVSLRGSKDSNHRSQRMGVGRPSGTSGGGGLFEMAEEETILIV